MHKSGVASSVASARRVEYVWVALVISSRTSSKFRVVRVPRVCTAYPHVAGSLEVISECFRGQLCFLLLAHSTWGRKH